MFAPPVAKPTTKPAELQHATVSAQRPSHSAVEQVHMLQPSIGIQAQQAGPSWDFAKIPVFPWGGAKRFRPSPLFPAARLPIQAKLEIGAVDDPLEHEADRVAEQVMRMPDPGVSIAAAPSRVNPKCAQCEEEEKLQTKQAGSQSAAGEAPSIVHEALRAPGQPLDAATRDYFEPRFGPDFSRVRVHTDAKAAESARTLDARAYTLGSDIVFASNAFSPATSAGRRLLAHELVHTAQQRNVPVRQVPLVGSPADFAEREADAVAESALAGQSMSLSARPQAGQVLRDTKEYQTAGIPLDPVEMEKWSTRSYWKKRCSRCLRLPPSLQRTPGSMRPRSGMRSSRYFGIPTSRSCRSRRKYGGRSRFPPEALLRRAPQHPVPLHPELVNQAPVPLARLHPALVDLARQLLEPKRLALQPQAAQPPRLPICSFSAPPTRPGRTREIE
jgi:hypothetical protein